MLTTSTQPCEEVNLHTHMNPNWEYGHDSFEPLKHIDDDKG